MPNRTTLPSRTFSAARWVVLRKVRQRKRRKGDRAMLCRRSPCCKWRHTIVAVPLIHSSGRRTAVQQAQLFFSLLVLSGRLRAPIGASGPAMELEITMLLSMAREEMALARNSFFSSPFPFSHCRPSARYCQVSRLRAVSRSTPSSHMFFFSF